MVAGIPGTDARECCVCPSTSFSYDCFSGSLPPHSVCVTQLKLTLATDFIAKWNCVLHCVCTLVVGTFLNNLQKLEDELVSFQTRSFQKIVNLVSLFLAVEIVSVDSSIGDNVTH